MSVPSCDRRVLTRRTCLTVLAGLMVVAGERFSASAADGSRTAEILAAIRTRVDAGKNTGMVVATIEADGGTSIAAYGSPGHGALPLDGDSVFEIGSITKVFTATLFADMVDRGEVKIDDPISRYLPADVRVPERAGRKITLLDLSTQSSGLPRLPNNMAPRDPQNPYADYSVVQLHTFLSGHALTRDIGSQYEYSNFGFGLLGHVLARRSGTTYEALMTERVLAPLRMQHTGITLTAWMQQHLAKGHDASGRLVPNWDLPVLAGAGALRSTMNDMLLFARANLDPSGGRLQRVMQQTHTARFPTGQPNLSIGLGWHIRRVDGHDIVWHNGGTAGYRTWMGLDKTRRIAAIVLTNSPQGADDLGYELLR